MISGYNLINIDESEELDIPIYRVFSFQRLLTLFKSGKNTLVKPSLWDDPLENFVLQVAEKAFRNHPHNFDFSTKDRFYGQCWSLLEESDAMWRIYSPEKNGIKVRTTIRKLISSLLDSTETSNSECFIGKVKYLKGKELERRLQDRGWLSQESFNLHNQAASLLFKRFEFEHEQEVRIIQVRMGTCIEDLSHYSIEPIQLFDEIQFDPRISSEMFDVFKHYLSKQVGFNKPISKSVLYQVPELHFE